MPKPVSASRTSSSLKGLKIAITIFIAYASTHDGSGNRRVEPAHAKGVPAPNLCYSTTLQPFCMPKFRALAQQDCSCHFPTGMENSPFDLAVIGAGLSGSVLALAAGRHGLRTALIDRARLDSMTDAGFDGRTTAVTATSQRLFEALGVWSEVAADAEPILDIRISDAGHDGDGMDRREPFAAPGGTAQAGGVPGCRTPGAGRGHRHRSRPASR